MESIAEAIDRLTKAGYADLFRAEATGVRAMLRGKLYTPADLVVEEVVRFEGTADPAEEVIVFALRCARDGTRGTYCIAYGPEADPVDTMITARLRFSTDCRRA